MGQCMSSGAADETSSAAASGASPTKDTALVLMPSGEMREYPRASTTAARVLDDASTSASASAADEWFLCDADAVDFDGPIPSLRDVELLRAGQIYFVLPAAARRRGLRREEVAALAVRASAALSSRAAVAASASSASAAAGAMGRRRRGAVVAPLVFAPPPTEEEQRRQEEAIAAASKAAEAMAAAAQPPVRRHAPRVRSGKRLERFASDLTAIPEGETTSE